MFEPVRGGTRGGQAEFKWSDVSADKDREHYLGHSVNAPTGRWQKNKDVHWYNRDAGSDEAERAEEIRKIKELEAQAINAVLGYEPTTGPSASSGPASGANSVIVPPKSIDEVDQRKREKEEKRRRKEERKEEKRARKEHKRLGHKEDRPRRRSSRSLSPRRRSDMREIDGRRPRSRSRTPPARSTSEYGAAERERERENDRRRWELNSRRDQPLDRRRY